MATIYHLSPVALVGGCEINCLRLIESLPDFKHCVLVFGEPGPMDERWCKAGAQVEHLAAWNLGVFTFQKRLREWAKGRPCPIGLYYWSGSRLPFVLKALTHWDVPWGVHLGNPFRGGVAAKLRLWGWQCMPLNKSRVTLVSCSNYVERSHRNAPFYRKFKNVTIYNPVSDVFSIARMHRELKKDDCPRVGMVARLDSIKDHSTLIRCMPALLRNWPGLVLEFAGEGNLRPDLVKLVEELEVGESVKFLGAIDNIPQLLQSWDIYLHSTTPNEGMGIAVAEAMVGGLPCVITNIEVMREVGGNSVEYVASGDHQGWGYTVGKLLGDLQGRIKLGVTASERGKELFSVKQVARAYLNVIKNDA